MADWLRAEIGSGLQKLLALRLPGTPPEDAIIGTAEVWLEAVASRNIQWVEHLDRQRVRRAFLALLRDCDRWPSPKLLLENLGNRDPPKALPHPILTSEEKARNRARLRAMLTSLTQQKQMNGARND